MRGQYVQVNRWPSMAITRLDDGGWRLESQWVVLEAELEPGGPYARGIAAGTAPHQA